MKLSTEHILNSGLNVFFLMFPPPDSKGPVQLARCPGPGGPADGGWGHDQRLLPHLLPRETHASHHHGKQKRGWDPETLIHDSICFIQLHWLLCLTNILDNIPVCNTCCSVVTCNSSDLTSCDSWFVSLFQCSTEKLCQRWERWVSWARPLKVSMNKSARFKVWCKWLRQCLVW